MALQAVLVPGYLLAVKRKAGGPGKVQLRKLFAEITTLYGIYNSLYRTCKQIDPP